ncbi:MAG: bifunctional phosphopantothenoylcysteine decarboxylase/phosphopantothenate--cysteine ligase CoaBC [Bacteriovoracaceae bacterium]|nr:bifunctional phosphopantothenoylcysteine decarboxylase/phosphopantothenate--cysteine ligase CoaBC [Bacteriovoracaceae bacterium]
MKIILGVTGSIAAYKTMDLCRLWIQAGHEVKVVLTQGALQFARPEVFTYLGVQDVFLPQDDFIPQKNSHLDSSHVLHIALQKWCDRIIIAPCSANTLSYLAHGNAHDLLTSLFLCNLDKKVVIYPAMNTGMLSHPFTQENWKRLDTLPHVVLCQPESGTLACGDTGLGRLPDIVGIAQTALIATKLKLNSKKILITTGSTIAPLDPVRFLTNPSTGTTGLYLALHYLSLGHEVTVVAGYNATLSLDFLKQLPQYHLIRVSTTAEMLKAVQEYFPLCDMYLSSAAVSDMEFTYHKEKIKKNNLVSSLDFNLAPDILKEMLSQKKPHQKIVGFAAETNLDSNQIMELNQKWENKNVDLLVGNNVSGHWENNSLLGFGDTLKKYTYYFMTSKNVYETQELNKYQLGSMIDSYLKI